MVLYNEYNENHETHENRMKLMYFQELDIDTQIELCKMVVAAFPHIVVKIPKKTAKNETFLQYSTIVLDTYQNVCNAQPKKIDSKLKPALQEIMGKYVSLLSYCR